MTSANNSHSRPQNTGSAENLHAKGAGRIRTAIIFTGFVVVFGSLTVTSFIQQSPTIDEPIHLLAGYSYVGWGDFRVNPEHPPFVKIWAVLPLLGLDIADPRPASPYWSRILETEPGGPVYPLAHDMFYVRNDAATLFFYAKLQMIILSIVLGAFVYVWARETFGIKAAMVSLFLYGLDPNVLAHSTIVHTDLPFAAFFFISTYFFWRALRNLTRINLLLAALFFGFAAITKHSFIAIVPVWLILGLIKVLSAEPLPFSILRSGAVFSRQGKAAVLAGFLGCAALAAYFSIWCAYGFRYSAVPGGDLPLFMTRIVPPYRPVAQTIQSFIVEQRLFPEALISGYLYNFKIWKHSAYLLGEISEDGFWSYFPIALAVKTPLPILLLSVVSLVVWFVQRRREPYLALTIPPFVYFGLAMLSRFNIGIRHLLPVYPFLFVLIGGVVEELWRKGSPMKKAGLVLVGVWYLWSSFSIHPDYLAFFNELTGGPKNGHKVLLDSNIDWGQGLKGLKQWMNANDVEKVQLFYFGTADPKYYGIDDFYSTENLMDGRSSAGQELELPNYLAVSANFLYGRKLFLPDELTKILASYRLGEPHATIGHSILVYKLDLADSRVYENAAIVTARKGALDRAIALFHKALQINPASATAYHQVGRLLIAQGKLDQAIEHIRHSLRLDPDYAEAHQSLGRALVQKGNVDEAAWHYEAALRILRGSRTDAKGVK
jgi:hypothetical protein